MTDTKPKLKTFTCDVRLYGTLYIQAATLEDAQRMAAATEDTWTEFAENAMLAENVELSPAITCKGPAPDDPVVPWE